MRIDFTNGLAFGVALFVGSVIGYLLGVARTYPTAQPRHAPQVFPLDLSENEVDLHIDQYQEWWRGLTPEQRQHEQELMDRYPDPSARD